MATLIYCIKLYEQKNAGEQMKFKLLEDIVMRPGQGKTYWFDYQGGIRSGVYKGSTNAWHIFSTDDGSYNMYVKKWANIATSKEDIERINGIVDRMAKDTYVPDVVHLPNRFTR